MDTELLNISDGHLAKHTLLCVEIVLKGYLAHKIQPLPRSLQ